MEEISYMNQTVPIIVQCSGCGAKNRIPDSKIGESAKCGKCGLPLKTAPDPSQKGQVFNLRCTSCGAKNRIPADRASGAVRCGKCKAPLDTGVLSNGRPVMVSDGNFEQTVLRSPLPVLVYCWSANCPTCRMTGPMIDQFAVESKGRVRVGKVNVEANPNFAARYNVLGVPFLFIFDNGQLKESLPGAIPKHDLMLKMARYI
ncbi:MAG: thiol reductase thioredoxin [Desulfobacteraceae bacterium]|nr:MAG: thiol reductase thioredoxin [Desulfobacteraceae bacterium]